MNKNKTSLNPTFKLILAFKAFKSITLVFALAFVFALSMLLCTSSFTPALAFDLPKTGQDKCYDMDGNEIDCPAEGEDLYGQDANYQAGKPRSYTKLDASGNTLPDSANEWVMVKDNVTGLIWEVKTDDGGIHDKDNEYTWYDPNSETNGGDAGTPGDGTDTHDFIQALNNANFGGYSDWRMPTIKELSSLVHAGKSYPAVNTDYFPNTQSSYYWSSSSFVFPLTVLAWRVSFSYGHVDPYDKSNEYYVRVVRSGQ